VPAGPDAPGDQGDGLDEHTAGGAAEQLLTGPSVDHPATPGGWLAAAWASPARCAGCVGATPPRWRPQVDLVRRAVESPWTVSSATPPSMSSTSVPMTRRASQLHLRICREGSADVVRPNDAGSSVPSAGAARRRRTHTGNYGCGNRRTMSLMVLCSSARRVGARRTATPTDDEDNGQHNAGDLRAASRAAGRSGQHR
jgi:hypothetical protein